MKKIISKPHIFFFILIPVLLLFGYLNKESTIDINIYNSFFVIHQKSICYISAVFFGLIGLNYFSLIWAKRPPKKWLTRVHIILQSISLILLFTRNSWNWIGENEYPLELNLAPDYSNLILIISFFFFLMATLIHLANFFISLMSKSK